MRTLLVTIGAAAALAACGAPGAPDATSAPADNAPRADAPADVPAARQADEGSDVGADDVPPLVIGGIPDQDPDKLARRFGMLAEYLEQSLGVPVSYRPVTDYGAAVTAFRVGDLDLVWFGGLTGVQARLQVPGAQAIVQRKQDAAFHSVFIASADSGIAPFETVDGLTALRGHSFAFGSESSTSGRLMPQHYLSQAGVSLEDFEGTPGFSGAHDRTIALVEAGSYDAGALNEQVWTDRVAAGEVDTAAVGVVWRTPPYYDYHWVVRPDVAERYGSEFPDRLTQAFLSLDAADPDDAAVLDLFSAERFIPTENDNYARIEAVGREIGKIQ